MNDEEIIWKMCGQVDHKEWLITVLQHPESSVRTLTLEQENIYISLELTKGEAIKLSDVLVSEPEREES
jgi:hypothetical protein